MFLKKITILSTLFFFLGASNVFAGDIVTDLGNGETSVGKDSGNGETSNGIEGTSNSTKSSSPQFTCEGGKDALCSEQFKITTSQFSPGGKSFVGKGGAKRTVDSFLTTLIKKLMIALGSLALLIMVVGAGFMIFAMGKDDNLNKGKTIFKSGLIALIIAMSSYYMVSFLSYILYS